MCLLRRCDGTWGIAVINKSVPGEIIVACNGSPMVCDRFAQMFILTGVCRTW
jgi:glucosamine 6-phosphate synthetase-like amidotransferase/phosphosugar isomerase protein